MICGRCVSNLLGPPRIIHHRVLPRRWCAQLSYHVTTVGDEHDFARLRELHVLAELVLELFDADDFHNPKVATGSYFDKYIYISAAPVDHSAR